jgi:hypothetical protein
VRPPQTSSDELSAFYSRDVDIQSVLSRFCGTVSSWIERINGHFDLKFEDV